jgi:outer membrane biosynthesis protein TonB
MSLASIAVVVCALLAPSLRDLGTTLMSQAEEPPKENFPIKTPSATEPSQPQSETPAKKPDTPKPPGKKKTPPKRRRTTSKRVPAKKRVVRNGSATEPTTQISPSVPQQQASSQLQNTNNLLNTADANLKSISGAQLSSTQEDMVKQVRTYMEQAKAAAGAGDLERAGNLATKAQLLSAELTKH